MKKLILGVTTLFLICISCDNVTTSRGDISIDCIVEVEVVGENEANPTRAAIDIKGDSLTLISGINAGTKGELIIHIELLIKENNSSNKKCTVKDRHIVYFKSDRYGNINLKSKENLGREMLDRGIDKVWPRTGIVIHSNNEIEIEGVAMDMDIDTVIKTCSKKIKITLENIKATEYTSNSILFEKNGQTKLSEKEYGVASKWWLKTYHSFDRTELDDALVDGNYRFDIYAFGDKEGSEVGNRKKALKRANAVIECLKPSVLDSKNHLDNFVTHYKEYDSLEESRNLGGKVIIKFRIDAKASEK